MGNLSIQLPRQRYSFKDKKKDDFKWGRDCIDAVTSQIYNLDEVGHQHYSSDLQRKLNNYRLYNNQIDQSDFERDCNPFGIESEELKDVVQPFNKTYNKINVLLGEELARPFNHKVYLVNSYAVDASSRHKTKLLREYLDMLIQSESEKLRAEYALQAGEITEENAEQIQAKIEEEISKIMNPEDIEKYMKTSWRDSKEILMDQLLQFFIRKFKIKKLKNDGMKHACIAAEEFAWVGAINGEPSVEILNPLKLFYHKSSETEYIQDGMYAGYRTRMTVADVLDRYADDLTDEDKEKLDSITSNSNLFGITDSFIKGEVDLQGFNKSLEYRMLKDTSTSQYLGQYGASTYNDIDVVHVEWRSQRKVAFLSYTDENGEQHVDLLDETFKPPASTTKVKYDNKYGKEKTKQTWTENDTYFELEYDWIPEIWEGTRIAGNIYVNIRPKLYQFRSSENPYKVKLGYHGLVYNAMNAPNISIMDRMKPFQYLYFIVMHKMLQIIAADMPPATVIDKSMIDKGLTNEQFFYYYKNGLIFYNPNQNNEGNFNPQLSGNKGPAFEVSRSSLQHVNQYVEILNWLDDQINQVSGVSAQREGQTSASEAVTNSQQNITQSSHITQTLFNAHNLLWEEILTSLIEMAQICYKEDEKKIPMVLDDMSRAMIKIQPDDITGVEFGAFIQDNPMDYQNLEQMRAQALAFIQNGARVSETARILRATSMEGLERDFQQLEAIRDKMMQAQEQATLQSQERIAQMQLEAREDEQAHQIEMLQMKIAGDLEKAAMTVYSRQEELDANQDGVPDPIAAAELQHKINIEQAKVQNDIRSQRFEEYKQAKELEERSKDRKLEEKKIASQEKIARSKPKPKSSK